MRAIKSQVPDWRKAVVRSHTLSLLFLARGQSSLAQALIVSTLKKIPLFQLTLTPTLLTQNVWVFSPHQLTLQLLGHQLGVEQLIQTLTP